MNENIGKIDQQVKQVTLMDPFCKQSWLEYGRRFFIYSATGLAAGAACAFVLLGKPTYRTATMGLGLGWGLGSAWTRTNVDIRNRRMAKRWRNDNNSN